MTKVLVILLATVGASLISGPTGVSAASVTCSAASLFEIAVCLVFQEGTDPLTIELTSDIELQAGQQISLSGRSNILIDGQGYTIRESGARAADGALASKEYIRIVSGSVNIELKNIAFRDHDGSDPTAPDMDNVCKLQNGAANSFDQNACRPLVQVGSLGKGVSDITMREFDVDSFKSFHVNVETVDTILIRDSVFINSSLYSVRFGVGLSTEVDILNNEFRRARTNAIIVDHTDGLRIRNNDFIDNHWAKQFLVCGGPCSGGSSLSIASLGFQLQMLKSLATSLISRRLAHLTSAPPLGLRSQPGQTL